MKLKLSNLPLILFSTLLLKSLIVDISYSSLGALAVSGIISVFLLIKDKDVKLEEFSIKIKELEKRVEESEKISRETRTYASSIKLSQQISGKN